MSQLPEAGTLRCAAIGLEIGAPGRPHNVHENWITCGNQLDGVRLVDEEMVKRCL